MKRLSVILFGGCYEVISVSTNDIWYEWQRKRPGWWARKVDALLNPRN